jgi:hypothetical protein
METSFPEEECSGTFHSTAMTKWWQAGLVNAFSSGLLKKAL